MQVVLPDVETHKSFRISADAPLSDEEFFDFCMENSRLRIERDASGEITIMPPAGFETGYRNNDLSRQLGNWRSPMDAALRSIQIRNIFFRMAPPARRTPHGS